MMRRGQSLIELLVAIAIGALFVISVATVIAPSLKENTQAANVQVGTAFGKELFDDVRVWAERDWHGIAALATGSINTYYLNTASSPFSIVSGASSTFPNGYSFRRTITIQGSQVSGGATLSSFPLLISLIGYADLAASSSGGALQRADGSDISFYADASGTNLLYSEKESYSSSTGAGLFWVNIPSLSPGTGPIYMFYGNPTPPNNIPTNVWDSNYKGVYHLDDLAAGTGFTKDSVTGNSSLGTVSGATSAATAKIAGAANFVAASSQYISMPVDLSATNQVTAEFWLYQPSYVSSAYSAGFTAAGTTAIGSFDVVPSNNLGKLEIWSEGQNVGTGISTLNDAKYTVLPAGWHDYAFIDDHTLSTNQISLYIDGSLYTTGLTRPGGNNADNTNNFLNDKFYLMSKGGASNFNTGIEDEVRISSNIRSADWIKTEYLNETNPTAFYTIGTATTPSGGSLLAETATLGGIVYTRSFSVADVYRSSTGTIVANPAAGTYDPSSKQVTINYSWPGGGSGALSTVLTRASQNRVFNQIDWSGGPGQAGPATTTNNKFAATVNVNYASTTGSIYIADVASTGTLDATTLDTGITAGAQLNSIVWHGTLPGGTSIGFQFATSSSSGGPWVFTGPNSDPNQYYALNQQPSSSYPLWQYGFNGIRYFRYRIILMPDGGHTLTPTVSDINIDWSP